MPTRRLLALFFAFFMATSSMAQQAESLAPSNHAAGEILFQLNDNQSVIDFEKKMNSTILTAQTPFKIKELASSLRMYYLLFDPTLFDENQLLTQLKRDPSVSAAQFNHLVELRGTPNDPLFAQQWNLQKINAPAAWDITTGGLTACGDTIVVAIIDGGFYPDMPELQGNLWVNKGETPNNGIDDDNNGIIDDYRGWNTNGGKKDSLSLLNIKTSTADIMHGTKCAGIIGAATNNGKLVAGVNWKIKMMLLSGILTSLEGGMIKAYEYVLYQRRLYDSTGGKKGAFVTVTSMSAGFRGGSPSDRPNLCAIYSELEKLGILNFVATTNTYEDVVTYGDMPAQCDKPSLVVVTGTNQDDVKNEYGFSAKFVHLAAPAKQVLVLSDNNDTEIDSGTSFATPLAAGAAALLWSMPEKGLCQLAKTKPVEAMNRVKTALLRGVDKLPSLNNKTVTGGRLNLKQSMNILRRSFGQPIGDFDIVQLFPNPVVTQLKVTLQLPENTTPDILITNVLGQVVYQRKYDPKDNLAPFLTINTENFASGLYILTIRTLDFEVAKKFVVFRK
jgi:hypothetical protein